MLPADNLLFYLWLDGRLPVSRLATFGTLRSLACWCVKQSLVALEISLLQISLITNQMFKKRYKHLSIIIIIIIIKDFITGNLFVFIYSFIYFMCKCL